MEIEDKSDFETIFQDRFGDMSKITLYNIKKNRIRINLGEDLDGESRVNQALERSKAILDFSFKGKEIWLQIILWDNDALIELKTAGINPDDADNRLEWKEDDNYFLALNYKQYSFQKILPICLSIINFDLAYSPSANITCYFIDFVEPIVVNIYDDRGCDIYSPSSELLEEFHKNCIVKSLQL